VNSIDGELSVEDTMLLGSDHLLTHTNGKRGQLEYSPNMLLEHLIELKLELD
jgi:hypothetical protein